MTEQDFQSMRRAMVDSQLRTTAVNDPRVVAAMAEVPREAYVPAERRALAYVDTLVPLGHGRFLNPPMVTGRLLTEAAVRPGDKALVVGAAGGYAGAVLAKLGAAVTALESDTALAIGGGDGVALATGPLQDGWAEGAPYDLILVDGAIEAIPPALIGQLAEGGRLAGVLVERGVGRLVVGVKAGDGFGTTSFGDADAAPLPGFAPKPRFKF